MKPAAERSDGSHANGAGPGAPASERVAELRGAKPPGPTMWRGLEQVLK
jgi:hypothetical protein